MSSLLNWWSKSANDVTSCSSSTVISVWSSKCTRSTGDVGCTSATVRPAGTWRRRRHSSCSESVGGSCGTAVHVSDWRTSFDDMLNDTNGLDLFTFFLRREYSEENILFWKDCQYYRQQQQPALTSSRTPRSDRSRKRLARAIYDEYVDPLMAPRQVNLDSEIVNRIRLRLSNPPDDIFDEAQQHVYLLMKRDSYGRFVSSPLYQQAVEDEESQGHHHCQQQQQQQQNLSHGSDGESWWDISDDDDEKSHGVLSSSRWRNLPLFPFLSLPWNRKSSSSKHRSLSTCEITSISLGGSGCVADTDEGRRQANADSVSSSSAIESSSKLSKWSRSRSATKFIGKLMRRLSVRRLSQANVDSSAYPANTDVNCNAIASTMNENSSTANASSAHSDDTLTTMTDNFVATEIRHSRGHRERSLSSQINRHLQSTPKSTFGTRTRVRMAHVWSNFHRQKRTTSVAGPNSSQHNSSYVTDRRLSDVNVVKAASRDRRGTSNKLLPHDGRHHPCIGAVTAAVRSTSELS